MSIFLSLSLQFDRGVLLRACQRASSRLPVNKVQYHGTLDTGYSSTRVLASTGVQVPAKLTTITVLEFCILLQGPGICHLFIICRQSRALTHHMRRVTRSVSTTVQLPVCQALPWFEVPTCPSPCYSRSGNPIYHAPPPPNDNARSGSYNDLLRGVWCRLGFARTRCEFPLVKRSRTP